MKRILIVKKGTWLYDNKVEIPVDIIGLNYDWWYELAKADGMLEPNEKPMHPGPEGLIYYGRFKRAGETVEPTWVDTDGHQELEHAVEATEAKVIGEILWQG